MYKSFINSILRAKSLGANVDLFQSERFRVQALRPHGADYQNYLAWMRDKKSNPFIIGIDPNMSLPTLEDYVLNKFSSSTTLLLGIYTKDQKKHIGNIKFELVDELDSLLEIGILIGDTNWRNKGVASEILLQSILYASIELKVTKIELGVHRDNLAAIRAYKKVGFKLVEQLDEVENLRMRYVL